MGQSSGGAGYPNGLAGGSVTLVTAPAAGVSRMILNQLTFVQTSPTPCQANGNTDVPNGGVYVVVYHANNYNGDGSTRVLSPVGATQTNASIARIAFPPSTFNSQKVGGGSSLSTATSQPLFTAGPGPAPNTFPFITPTSWGQPGAEQGIAGDYNTTCISPTNIYLGPNDQLIARVATSQTGNTAYVPTYTVSWSFTLITET